MPLDKNRVDPGDSGGSGEVSSCYGFAPAFFNLCETTRMLHIALELRRRGEEVVFFSHGGHFEHLVEERGLPVVQIEPRLSEQLIEHMLQIARFEKLGNFLTVDQIRSHVTAEVSAYRQHRLRALVTGFNFTSSISARVVGVPLVWFVQAPSVTEYYTQRLAAFPDALLYPPLRVLPRRFLDWLTNVGATRIGIGMGPFNKVAGEYGVAPFATFLFLLRGDLTLIGDLLELTRLRPTEQLPPECFVGPILSAVSETIDPAVADHIDTGRRAGRRPVFLAMGSSGNPELFSSIVGYLDTRHDLQPVVAYTNIVTEEQLPEVSDRVLLRRLVLAEEVARRVDLAIIHGGHGTTYTQAYSGTPFIGIPMQAEQQYNLDALVQLGCGLVVPRKRFREADLGEAIDTIFANYDHYKENAMALRERLPESRAVEESANLILSL